MTTEDPQIEVPRAYPLPRTDEDSRFTHGLLWDISVALEEHGYPAVREGQDIVALQQAVFGFIYGREARR